MRWQKRTSDASRGSECFEFLFYVSSFLLLCFTCDIKSWLSHIGHCFVLEPWTQTSSNRCFISSIWSPTERNTGSPNSYASQVNIFKTRELLCLSRHEWGALWISFRTKSVNNTQWIRYKYNKIIINTTHGVFSLTNARNLFLFIRNQSNAEINRLWINHGFVVK